MKKFLMKALTLQNKRGPDDYGIINIEVKEGLLKLGHRRLSIIDLTDGAHQPMVSEDKRYHIIFNGEIYNYKELREKLISRGYQFKSESDTEVLLHAWIEWKEECLHFLDGMFAFSIYDSLKNKLFCVRDAFGLSVSFILPMKINLFSL